jgi:hypothetical protein
VNPHDCVFCTDVVADDQLLAYCDQHTVAFPPLQQRWRSGNETRTRDCRAGLFCDIVAT